MHVVLIKTAKSLVASRPDPQTKVYSGLIQIPCQEDISSKV